MSEAQRCVMAPPYHPRLNRVAGESADAAGWPSLALDQRTRWTSTRAVFKADYF